MNTRKERDENETKMESVQKFKRIESEYELTPQSIILEVDTSVTP